jgi:hypothetical protein
MEPSKGASPPQPPPPPVAPVKKKTSPLVWILVGCLGLMVVGGIIFAAATFFVAKKVKDVASDFADNPVRAAAEMAIRMNPDLELVSTDDAAQTMTVRDKTTGKVSTFDWSDIENGKFSFETDGETYTLDGSGAEDGQLAIEDESGNAVMSIGSGDVPSWFPTYPDTTGVNVLVNANQNGQESRIWTFQSNASPGDLLAFYKERLEADGWSAVSSLSDEGGRESGSLDAERDGGSSKLNLVVTKSGAAAAQVMATYTGGA